MSIKSCFKSRFPNGYIMEVDFSQLEVVGLAILSGDDVLKDDILSGRDMHRWRAAELLGKAEADVTEEERRLAKQLSFQLQYGAGYKSLAAKNGISEELAKKFIANYYDRYEEVAWWQANVKEEVESSRKPSGTHTAEGLPRGVGEHVSPTGRVYRFFEYDPPSASRWGKRDARFSPTEIKNYPVQGFATADIMALYRGRVYRRMMDEGIMNEAKLINTVHDSVMLDVASEEMVRCVHGVLSDEADKLPGELERLWGIKTSLPLKVETKYGKKWSELKKL